MILIWNDAPSVFADISSPCPAAFSEDHRKSGAGIRMVSFPAADPDGAQLHPLPPLIYQHSRIATRRSQ
jgi:hypothetical protein